jgi:hypothetical protein
VGRPGSSAGEILDAQAILLRWKSQKFMAEEAGTCEPFSVPNSLLTGKNTGNLEYFDPLILWSEAIGG